MRYFVAGAGSFFVCTNTTLRFTVHGSKALFGNKRGLAHVKSKWTALRRAERGPADSAAMAQRGRRRKGKEKDGRWLCGRGSKVRGGGGSDTPAAAAAAEREREHEHKRRRSQERRER